MPRNRPRFAYQFVALTHRWHATAQIDNPFTAAYLHKATDLAKGLILLKTLTDIEHQMAIHASANIHMQGTINMRDLIQGIETTLPLSREEKIILAIVAFGLGFLGAAFGLGG